MFDLSLPGEITAVSLLSCFDRTISVRFVGRTSINDRLTGGDASFPGIWRNPSRNSLERDLAVKLCICLGVSIICTSGVNDLSFASSTFATCETRNRYNPIYNHWYNIHDIYFNKYDIYVLYFKAFMAKNIDKRDVVTSKFESICIINILFK